MQATPTTAQASQTSVEKFATIGPSGQTMACLRTLHFGHMPPTAEISDDNAPVWGETWRTRVVRTAIALVCAIAISSSAVNSAFGIQASNPADRDNAGETKDGSGSIESPQGVDATASAASTGEVDVRVGRFGIANAARVGDWCGVLVEIQDSGAKVRNLLIRMAIRDADGDITNTQRVAIHNPGRWEGVWLYARLPFSIESSPSITITVHEAIEGGGSAGAGDGTGGTESGSAGDGAGTRRGFTAGRVLGRTEFPVNRFLPSHVSTIAVVGDRTAGLDQYPNTRLTGSGSYESPPPTGHELIEVVRGIKVLELPDRWMGWTQFPTLVWTSGSQEQPSQMSVAQADAIRQWVHRGGHFVVVLPPVGQGWIGPSASGNRLADIMPTVSIRRVEGVDLDALRPVLTLDRGVTLPRSSTVQYLIPNSNTDPYSAISVLNGPGGDSVVARRLVGAGAVTVIGVDVTTPALTDVSNALQAHVFWGRILGKRMQTPTRAEIAQKENSQIRYPSRPNTGTNLDDQIQQGINLSAQSAAGLLLAFVVFLLYWLAY